VPLDANRLEQARALVDEVLAGERTEASHPELIQDDLLAIEAGVLSKGDPGWLLARLLDRSSAFDARLLVVTQLSAPPRAAALADLRDERPEHPLWRMFPEFQPKDGPSARVAGPIAGLRSADPKVREGAAEDLRDATANADLPVEDYVFAVEALLAACRAEDEADAREAMFNALSEAATAPADDRTGRVDWSPLAATATTLDDPECLEHVVLALGGTGDPRYRLAVERLREHPSPNLRRACAEALEGFAG
jgi:hypothetical protein